MPEKGRDSTSGRFLMGHKGGPGAPKGHRRQALADAFYEAVSLADVKALAKTLVRLAKAGDPVAARLILERFVGRMPQGLEISGELTSKLEGVNNKIKVVKRIAYGFHDLEYFALKVKQALPGRFVDN